MQEREWSFSLECGWGGRGKWWGRDVPTTSSRSLALLGPALTYIHKDCDQEQVLNLPRSQFSYLFFLKELFEAYYEWKYTNKSRGFAL